MPRVDIETIRRGAVPARWFARVPGDASDSAPDSASSVGYSFDEASLYSAYSATSAGAQYAFRPSRSTISFRQTKSNDAPVKTANIVNVDERNNDGSTFDCELCARRCRIAPGKTGFCSARYNDGETLRTRFYGRPISIAVDPIEKKPLHHFLPGTRILSLGTFGCTLACRFCQNWQISRSLPIGETIRNITTPEAVVETALAQGCPSVAFTYNEPTVWAEFVVDVARLCREAGIRTVAVTNGTITGRAREEFFGAVDAANVDLKAFSDDFYRQLTGGSLDAVRETLRYIVENTQVWLEITNLLIPTKNDSPDETARLCDWVAETLGPEIPLHFSAFFPTHRLTDVPPTPPATVAAAARIARRAGIRFVYEGNVAEQNGNQTFCPDCGTPLIERSGYATRVLSALTPTSKGTSTRADVPAPNARVRFERFCGNCERGIPGVFD